MSPVSFQLWLASQFISCSFQVMASWGNSFLIVYKPVSLCGCIKISFLDAEHFPTHLKYTHTHIYTYKEKID